MDKVVMALGAQEAILLLVIPVLEGLVDALGLDMLVDKVVKEDCTAEALAVTLVMVQETQVNVEQFVLFIPAVLEHFLQLV
jgi:hypothetical protein